MKTLLLIALQLAANGADAYYTNRNLHQQNFVEHNVIAQPFVHNTKELELSMGAAMAGSLYMERRLRLHGHKQWADALVIGNVAGHTYGALTSAIHYQTAK